jgi:quinohemoprotein ethanol dehydrogenase
MGAGMTAGVILAGIVLGADCDARSTVSGSPATLLDAAVAPGDWPMNGRTFDGAHFSPLSDINASTIARLGLAWEFDDFVVRGRTHRGAESSPVLRDGILYFTGPWSVAYAVDAHTGKRLWSFDPGVDGQYARVTCCDAVNRGLAVRDGVVYVAALDGFLFALDVKTGKQRWKIDTIYDHRWNYSVTGAPWLAGDKVLIGNSGGEMGARGYVSAYDAASGNLAWRFWAVPGDPKRGPDESPEVALARKTWPADTRWELGLGGTAWDAMSYDPETDTVFVGLGNGDPHPQWLRSAVHGDELFLSSIVALNAKTGHMKWFYQTTPGDNWDYDATQAFIMADLVMRGRLRKVIMQAPKNGFFYVLDRNTGKLLRADKYTKVTWAHGVDIRSGRPRATSQGNYRNGAKIVYPSLAGGHSWQPMAFSPRTHLVYVPVYETAGRYHADKRGFFKAGTTNMGISVEFPPFDLPPDVARLAGETKPSFEARLKAWDPVAGTARWTSEALAFLSGGVLVAGDTVFLGSSDGYFYAYDSVTGAQLLKLPVGTAILAAPITYKLDGVQYIAVMAGMGGPQAISFQPGTAAHRYVNSERLVVFKLDGTEVPLPPLRTAVASEPIPAKIDAAPATILLGQTLFDEHCRVCHMKGGADGMYPNLWNMPPGTVDAFEGIVGGGAYRYAGMANFSDVLSAADIAALKAFIVDSTVAKRSASPH